MTDKQVIISELDDVPESLLGELRNFIRFLKQKAREGEASTAVLSESSLAKDWLRPEEDEAWRDL